MSDLDDFARGLRATVDETIPVRRIGGQAALASVKRRTRARAVRGALVATACVALVGVGLISVPRLDVHLLPASARPPAPAPYEGGLITPERYREIAEYLATCPQEEEPPTPSAEKEPDDVVPGAREEAPTLAPFEYQDPCGSAVNFRRAEIALDNQTRLLDVSRDDAFAEFVQCMAAEEVAVTASDTLDTVKAKAKDALAAGSDEDAVNTCLDGYTPRLYG